MSQITTHVLDTSLGRPGVGIQVSLAEKTENGWIEIAKDQTDDDGRITSWMNDKTKLKGGSYRITFLLKPYFQEFTGSCFYPEAAIVFNVNDNGEHYHIPLLLSKFGYSTYRGS